MDKIILTDVDGVLLNWEYAFHVWMKTKGWKVRVEDKGLFWNLSKQYDITDEKALELVEIFNESAAIGFLPPLRDAVTYVNKLHHEHGYTFHAITSMSDDPSAGELRRMNLEKVFGEEIFDRVECLPIGSPKNQYLKNYTGRGHYWIEDHLDNARAGLDVGLKPLLMEHGYNLGINNPGITVVRSWKEIYQIIIDGKISEPDSSYIHHQVN